MRACQIQTVGMELVKWTADMSENRNIRDDAWQPVGIQCAVKDHIPSAIPDTMEAKMIGGLCSRYSARCEA